tara:strand:- start:702 stop:974 length:273 start_codon:yes stop_codon:yes gene_type:complete
MLKNKKSIHINIDPDHHSHFKVQCVKRDLSMQEVFAAFAKRVGLESSDMMRFLDQIANDKSVHSIKKKYTKSDIDSIFSIIQEDNTPEDV